MRIYRTNQEAHSFDEPAENVREEQAPGVPATGKYAEEGMWQRCPSCATILYADDWESSRKVCAKCGHHFRLTARERIEYTVDVDSFLEFNENIIGKDPLSFPGYMQKLDGMRKDTGLCEAIVTGECRIGGNPCVIAVMDGFFMMGSMGAALGEKFTLAAERAIEKKLPLIAFTVSGGARMQEGLISLMQMSKTAAVLGKLDEAGLPYIVVLTDPTTGGVTASFAMLGDITIAEPNAVVGFAGRRVIEQTVKQVLPQTFQRAEFLLEKGFVDVISAREKLPGLLAKLLKMHKGGGAS